MFERLIRSPRQILVLASVVLMSVASMAQGSKPATATSSDSPSRWDIFLGYSYLAPKGTVTTTNGSGTPASASYDAVNVGGLFSGAYFFNRNVGAQVELGEHEYGDASNNGSNIGLKGNDDGFMTVGGGLIIRFPTETITPFAHALVDAAMSHGPYFEGNKWGPGLTIGGGMDYDTPLLDHHLAIRLFQADYEYMHADWGPVPYGGRANINAARLSAGVVFHVGSIAPPAPVTLACPANPTTVYPGDPVTLTANAGGLDPKDHVIYSWSGAGASGSDPTVKLDTSSLAPGEYTVTCNVKEGKPGKEGLKPWETATGTAGITVKAFEPPTIGCSANPSSVNPGDSATITATGTSPQNRPLTYSYSATAGTVSGNGPAATWNSAGAPTGTSTVTCNVSDDKGNTASSTAMVNVVAPPPPPPPAPSPEEKRLEARLALHSVFFPTAQPRAEHPEGGLVESQQATLTTLATDFKNYLSMKPDARLTLTGHTDVRGSTEYNQALSDRRVNRVKQFLVEQGVPDSSIETRAVGEEQQLSADQVKALVEESPDLSDADRAKVLHRLSVIVLAQNRRVDISLSTTGQESVQLYPFNAADSATLLSEKAPAPKKKAAPKKP
jgi:outer membrane protein OmpA-like peptidoglycan-associated protein